MPVVAGYYDGHPHKADEANKEIKGRWLGFWEVSPS